MPLYDVTHSPDSLVDPKKAEKYHLIQALFRKYKSKPQTLQRIIKTIDEAIDAEKPSKLSNLVWTKAGKMFGHDSERPKKNVDHLWDKVISAVGNDKNCLKTVGSLLRWRLSLRPEIWLVYRQDMGSTDPDTGKAITVSNYWINPTYIFKSKPKKQDFSLSDLTNKFNRKPSLA